MDDDDEVVDMDEYMAANDAQQPAAASDNIFEQEEYKEVPSSSASAQPNDATLRVR